MISFGHLVMLLSSLMNLSNCRRSSSLQVDNFGWFLPLLTFFIIRTNGVKSMELNYPDAIDFTPFRDTISIAVKSGVQPTPLTKSSSSDQCAMPMSSIMFTYTSHYMMDLIILQHKAMETWGLKDCLESRFVTACLDPKCLAMCESANIPNCCLLNMPELPGSDFGKNAYNYFTYLKHELMFEALKVVEEVFFFDADTLIFRNPWVETQFGRNEQGQQLPGPYDIQYQRDAGRGPSCSGSVNSGQVFLKNSTKTQVYVSHMVSLKQTIIKGDRGLDQNLVSEAYEKAGLKNCAFSTSLYTAHCPASHNPGASLSAVVTYHTSCVEGLSVKKQKMHRMLQAVQAKKKSDKLGQFA